MQSIKVGELMVPVAEYAAVSEEATLYDAVLALEEAQQKIQQEHQKYWSVLVLDKNQRVVGKIGRWDMLMAIEPRYKRVKELKETSRFGFSPEFYKSMLEDHGLWRNPLEDLCKKAATVKVKEIMTTPAEGKYIAADASLDEAIHRVVTGKYQSLLVMRGETIVGVLLLSDLYRYVCDRIKVCRI